MNETILNLHHIGFACKNFGSAVEHIRFMYSIKEISPIIFDIEQNVEVCLIKTENSVNIELVRGESVSNFIKNETTLYHLCYEVNNLEHAIDKFISNGAFILVEPKPAKLFDNRRVIFLQTELGIIELLESKSECEVQKEYEKVLVNKQKLDLVVASTFNVDLLKAPLQKLISSFPKDIETIFLPYNQIFQQLYDSNSKLVKNENGFNLILIRISDFFYYSENQDGKVSSKILYEFCDMLKKFMKISKVPCILFFAPDNNHFVLESDIRKKIQNFPNLYIVSEEIIKNYFNDMYHDYITNEIAHVPYTEIGFSAIALSFCRFFSGFFRPISKVIVVDCDNTLWNGVCGEVGHEGIVLSPDKVFIQKMLIEQFDAGMLLCLVSKNNEINVFNVFDFRADMLLKREHFVVHRINWLNKSDNIRSISEELGLSLDSFIFIDDNPIECAEVEASLPQVLIVQLPKKNEEIPSYISNVWAFDHHFKPEEHHKRTHYYKQNIAREQIRRSTKSLEDFIKNLNISVTFSAISINNFNRVSELTYRVNQFCFIKEHFHENEIQKYIENGMSIITTTVEDRFGSYGLVGLMGLSIVSSTMIVNHFFLSCRVLGRGVEFLMLEEIAKRARKLNLNKVKIKFIKTDYNYPAYQFLESLYYQNVDSSGYTFDALNLIDLQYTNYLSGAPKRANEKIKPEAKTKINAINIANTCFSIESLLKDERNNENELTDLGDINNINAIQQKLIEVFQYILQRKNIETEDCFFSVGGNSLLAIQLISRIYKLFDLRLSVKQLYENSTASKLTTVITFLKISTSKVAIDIPEQNVYETAWPLSPQQQQILFMSKLDSNGYVFNMPLAIEVNGSLDTSALEYAWRIVIKKHAAFRTSFHLEKGETFQVIHALAEHKIKYINLLRYDEEIINDIVLKEEQIQFDLTKAPLLRTTLINCGKEKNVLLITLHHIIFDGWSYKLINDDLKSFYQAYLSGNDVKIKNDDFSHVAYIKNQIALYEKNEFDKQKKFWRDYLEKSSILNLPSDLGIIKNYGHFGAYHPLILKDSVLEKIKEHVTFNKVSLFSWFLSIFSLLVSSFSKQTDFVIGTVSSGRDLVELEDVVGLFVKTLLIRINFEGSINFVEFSKQCYQSIIDILSNQNVTFQDIIKNLPRRTTDLWKQPITAAIIYHNIEDILLDLPDINIDYYKKRYNIARFDLIFEIEETTSNFEMGFYLICPKFGRHLPLKSTNLLILLRCLIPKIRMFALSIIKHFYVIKNRFFCILAS